MVDNSTRSGLQVRFYTKITIATRSTNNHGTLINNIFGKLTEHTLETFSGIFIGIFSDHQPYFTILNSLQTTRHAPKYIIKTKQDPQSILDFEQEAITSLLQQSKMYLHSEKSPARPILFYSTNYWQQY